MDHNKRSRKLSSSSSDSGDSESGWRFYQINEEGATSGGAGSKYDGTETATEFQYYKVKNPLPPIRHHNSTPEPNTTGSEAHRNFQLSKLAPLPRLQKLTPGQKMAAQLLWAFQTVQDEIASRDNGPSEHNEPEQQDDDEEMPMLHPLNPHYDEGFDQDWNQQLPRAMLDINGDENKDNEAEQPPVLTEMPRGGNFFDDDDEGMVYSDDDIYQDFADEEAPKKKKAKKAIWKPTAAITPFITYGDYIEDDEDIPEHILYPTDDSTTSCKPVASRTSFFSAKDYVTHDSEIPREILDTSDIPGPSGYTNQHALDATKRAEKEWHKMMEAYWKKEVKKEKKKKDHKDQEENDEDMEQD